MSPRRMRQLYDLDVGGLPMTDAVIMEMARNTHNLRRLNISRTRVTGQCLRGLASLKLSLLRLRGVTSMQPESLTDFLSVAGVA